VLAKASGCRKLIPTQMMASATVTQKAWFEIRVSKRVCSLSDVTS